MWTIDIVPDSAYLQLVDPGFEYGFASDRERPWRGIITDDGWKYAVFAGVPWFLYNLNEDPFETAKLGPDRRFNSEWIRLQAGPHPSYGRYIRPVRIPLQLSKRGEARAMSEVNLA